MRVFVQIWCADGNTTTHVIDCEDLGSSVYTLKKKAFAKTSSSDSGIGEYLLTISSNGAVLNESDVIKDVLKDNEFLTLHPKHYRPVPTIQFSDCGQFDKLKDAPFLEIDGCSLRIEDLMKIGRGEYRVKLTTAAENAVNKSRKVLDEKASGPEPVYGVTTGFGSLAGISVAKDKLAKHQQALIKSHSVGVGQPLSPEQTRRMLALRINVLAKGLSGVRLETLYQLVDAINACCLSYIPEKGSVGASGDLAPLAHLALGLMGEGLMWSPESGWADAKFVLEAHGLKPIELKAKEGLALINGTQFITGIGAEAVHRSELIAKQADVVAALTFEALLGNPIVFDEDLHANRPHKGQQLVAKRHRALVGNTTSHTFAPEEKRQDPYSLRCIPQVHGVVTDTLEFVHKIIETEINSAQDNPSVLSDRGEIISGGNFHGEYPSKALDYLAIGIHELANISERRMEKLINSDTSWGLPAFLSEDAGVNSGFMIAQYTSAALVSENKVLTHPSSVDSIPTSAGQEDHVSMGGFSARKALTIVKHVEHVLAIELLAACQAVEFREKQYSGWKTTAPMKAVHELVRKSVKPLKDDRFMAPDIEKITELLQKGEIWSVVAKYMTN